MKLWVHAFCHYMQNANNDHKWYAWLDSRKPLFSRKKRLTTTMWFESEDNCTNVQNSNFCFKWNIFQTPSTHQRYNGLRLLCCLWTRTATISDGPQIHKGVICLIYLYLVIILKLLLLYHIQYAINHLKNTGSVSTSCASTNTWNVPSVTHKYKTPSQ